MANSTQIGPLLEGGAGTYVGRLEAEGWIHPGSDGLFYAYGGPGLRLSTPTPDMRSQIHVHQAHDEGILKAAVKALSNQLKAGSASRASLPPSAIPGRLAPLSEGQGVTLVGNLIMEVWQSAAGLHVTHAVSTTSDPQAFETWITDKLLKRLKG